MNKPVIAIQTTNPEIPNWLRDIIQTLFKAEIFTWAAKLKALVHISSEVGAQAWLQDEGLKKESVFKATWGLWTSRNLDYTGRAVWAIQRSFLLLKQVCFNAAMLFCCEAPEMFCGLLNFTRLSIWWGWEDNIWLFIFEWICPIIWYFWTVSHCMTGTVASRHWH